MKIEIHHIPTQGLVLDFEKPARSFSSLKTMLESGDCEFLGPLEIHLDVLPMSDFIRVKGRLAATIRQACARCLEAFESSLHTHFTLNYSREIPKDVHKADTDGIELTAQQIGMVFFEGEEIDFTDAIQEQVILAMPIKPICKADCKGLCSRCGNDLNIGPCRCDVKKPDGPFAILKALKLPLEK